MMKAYIPLLLLSAVLLASCSSNPVAVEYRLNLPDQPYNYLTLDSSFGPGFFPFVDNTPFDNQLTNEGATLGRVLFYDRRLSANNLISCGSCHFQDKGFADPQALSTGFFTEHTRRNSKSIANMRFENEFFWDGRAHLLEEQVMMPIADHIEMGMENEEHLLSKLSKVDYYPELFEQAFGTPEITHERMSKALAQFLRSMTSLDTKYDRFMNWSGNEPEPNFTSAELNGMELFFDKLHCGSCHNGVNLSGWGTANIGLDIEYSDNGAGEIESGPDGAFRIPSLRNVALTGPYMHDGRFETLEDVIRHYANDVQQHEFLDFRLRHGGWVSISGDLLIPPNPGVPGVELTPIRLSLNDNQVDDIVAFLRTLTDQQYINDVRFSDPFVQID